MDSIDVRHDEGDILVSFSLATFGESLRGLCAELQDSVPNSVCGLITERRAAFLRSRDQRRWMISVPNQVRGTVNVEVLFSRELVHARPPAQLEDVLRVVHRF